MKHKIILLLILLLCICVGCGKSDSDKSKKELADEQAKTEESSGDSKKQENSQTGMETEQNSQDPAEGDSSGKITDANIPDRDKNVTSQADATTTPEDPGTEHSEEKQQSTLPSQSPSQEQHVNTNPPVSNEPSVEDEVTQETASQPTTQPISKAGKADERVVADKVLEYINSYRQIPAIRLSGLTGYAEYRSRQLVSNFAHDTNDQRAAATALQYGEYIDPTVFGGSGESYYRANAREAIAKAGYAGSVDYVAQQLARLVYESASHWKYIGDSEYTYIAVGVTYQSDMWYCAITVAIQNTDEI